MVRNILTYTLLALATIAFGAYFWFSGKLDRSRDPQRVCDRIDVVIADSAENRFIQKKEVSDVVQNCFNVKGRRLDSIDCAAIEKQLDRTSAVRTSQAYVTDDGVLHIVVRQHRPVARIQKGDIGFYIDSRGWIFPLQEDYTSYVTIVTGSIPISVDSSTRGFLSGADKEWIDSLLPLVNYLAQHDYWNAQIEQVYIDPDGDSILCPKNGRQKIVFGGFDRCEDKFDKLLAFYEAVVPQVGEDRYSEVNLKYRNQIICK